MLYHEGEYKQIFQDTDKDKDGYITYEDLRKVILAVDHLFPEHLLQKAFRDAKTKVPPADKMDLQEFMDAMSRLNFYRSGVSVHNGPILFSTLSGNLTRWLKNPRYARYIYEEFFRETDTDHDDFITYKEFQAQTKKCDMEYLDKTIVWEFKKHNTRGDGYMSLVEFMIAMGFPPLGNEKVIKRKPAPAPVKVEPPKKENKGPKFQLGESLLKQIFKSMDQDGDGVLNKREIKQVFDQLGQDMSDDEVDEIFRTHSKGDGDRMTFDEFVGYAIPSTTNRI